MSQNQAQTASDNSSNDDTDDNDSDDDSDLQVPSEAGILHVVEQREYALLGLLGPGVQTGKLILLLHYDNNNDMNDIIIND